MVIETDRNKYNYKRYRWIETYYDCDRDIHVGIETYYDSHRCLHTGIDTYYDSDRDIHVGRQNQRLDIRAHSTCTSSQKTSLNSTKDSKKKTKTNCRWVWTRRELLYAVWIPSHWRWRPQERCRLQWDQHWECWRAGYWGAYRQLSLYHQLGGCQASWHA